MSSTSKPAARACYNLPASLILTSRELKLYRRWQSLHTTLRSTECGSLPTAIEYEDFQQWLKNQDSVYFSDVFDDIYEHIMPSTPSEPTSAALCRHAIHPVETKQLRLRCPVCTIDIHINYMKVLTRSLHGANGRPLPRTGTPSEQQESLYLAWLQGKISALRQVNELEELSTKEAEWAKSHPTVPCGDIYSATKALELYWFETTECQSTNQCSTKKKSISFAEGTDFLPGRPTDYFLRKSPRYEAGKYTMTDEDQEDRDDVSEDSEDYSGARVFVLGGPEPPESLDTVDELEESAQIKDPFEDLDYDDGDSDWEDIESDEEDEESFDGSYICFEDEDTSFVVFSND